MDLTNLQGVLSYPDPIEMPVSELLTGVYVFSIPSYQRGYRWESSEVGITDNDVKQVDDLLNDLTAFANANAHHAANYYLQPLMVKPKQIQGTYEWDVLDGQQRLTTLLLVLRCINEKLYSNNPLPLYSIRYENRKQLDFGKITYNRISPNYDFPVASDNLDSYFVRKAKDRIERWYDEEIKNDQSLQDKIKELLFYPDKSRTGVSSPPSLRAKFIWYNVEPISATVPLLTGNRLHDIEIFNRLNRGKISLTSSELIKALFLLCIKNSPSSGSSLISPDTLVRKWDEMGKKFQNDEFWKMIAPKDTEYSNRMDLLFDFIRDCLGGKEQSSYRFYYGKMHPLLSSPNIRQVENLWNEIKLFFDTLCKWHENVQMHNYIGFLVDNGERISSIYNRISNGKNLADIIKVSIGIKYVDDIETLNYQDRNDLVKIRKILLLFNVLTCDKYGQKFPFNLYRDNAYDVEHINSQTDNPIDKIDEKREWIVEHAIACLWYDRTEKNAKGFTQAAIEARDLIIKGIKLLKDFQKNGKDLGEKFKPYREEVENYYARGSNSDNRHLIGNLTLLNSSINREYKNALFPKKLRTLKRSDQEGVYIPLCTKYMFLKYYSNPQGNVSAFNMMRWRDEDQEEYIKAIKDTIKIIF
ncbi:MAG: DUF262 domain-containing protein [bacterium]|nr:DUF262 domain-containing protein [bacterium]